ncbi:MAG: DEAD/DEAH box helicase [Myxococcales bacterium]|nr:DEAD/DEAH box helicase [Myxococcales bacterium]
MGTRTDQTPPAPGSRVRVRGEEWAVQKCLPLPMGGYSVYVQGVSELVRHHQAIFMSPLDTDIEPLKPEDTKLVADTSPSYRQSTLYLETLLRRTPPIHDRVSIGHRGALDVMPFQLVPARQSLASLRPRILIADGTGLGKTVEVGILLTELIKRGRGRRILVVAIRSMLAQLQRELWARFTLPLVRLDSEGLVRVQSKIPANRNPFSYFDRCIVSMDTLKNNGLYRTWLEQIRWDAIVVDECHNVANRGSQRAELARLLAAQCDALILTSATPHNGRPESFANLMRMLDPTSIADPQSFTREDVGHLFVRRFKKDVEAEAGSQLQAREVAAITVEATREEEAALAALHALSLSTLGRRSGHKDPLVKWTLVKSFLSSAEAALESLDNRIAATSSAVEGDEEHPRAEELVTDGNRLREARALVDTARAQGSSKLERFFRELDAIGFDGKPSSPRVVVFSERIATLDMLATEMATRLKMKPEQIATYTASSATQETKRREIVESFGHADSPLRVLLCSDAASEGVNLHHQCHHLFHYDVPWSIIRLTQRNGRIDRFGQHHTPQLRYMVTKTAAKTADQRVVERLIEKEREIERQLGDSGALLGLYDAEAEEELVTRGVARGQSAEELLPDHPLPAGAAATQLKELGVTTDAVSDPGANEGVDLLALFAEVEREQRVAPPAEELTSEMPSLFKNDYELVVAALRHLEKSSVVGPEPLQWTHDDATTSVELHAPEPFRRHREGFLPREGVPAKGKPYRLAMGRKLVGEKLRAALDDEGRWPDWHLLWEQHPLVEWLFDALGAAYARGEAPILRMASLAGQPAIFLLQGMMFNHESEAVEARWLGLPVVGDKISSETLSLDEVIARTGLAGVLVNSGEGSKRLGALQALVPAVVAEARARVVQGRRDHVKDELSKRARKETRRLEAWAQASAALLDEEEKAWAARERKIPQHVHRRLERERQHVKHVEENHKQLLKSLQALGEPYIRIVAAFVGE